MQHLAVVQGGLPMATLTSPEFLIACAPLAILCLLSLFPWWARFNDSPWIFAVTHSIPFFILTFRDSLGDAGQVTDAVGARYHMSEPLATWTHYWFFKFLAPYNIGAKDAIAWSSRVGGVFYCLFLAMASMRLFPDLSASRRLLYRLMFLTPGVALLCYGYIENPPLALPAEQLWIAASVAFLANPSFLRAAGCAAALALTTAIHGRAGFLFPALAIGYMLPPGSLLLRFTRGAVGSVFYFGLLGALVAYIFYIEPHFLSGGMQGNVTGGGNRQMFVKLSQIFTYDHIMGYLSPMLIAGGILAPLGITRLITMWFKPRRLDLWCLFYLAASLVYVLGWEFDYGPYIDWDLVFSAVTPLILMASLALIPSRIPNLCFLPFLLGTVYLSNTFAIMVNGAPLALNTVPTAQPAAPSIQCQNPGLLRTYYEDEALSVPVGTPEADIPLRDYGPNGVPFPAPGKPLGGSFVGYISIPEPGRYRFFLVGQRNIRLRVGEQSLVERWINYEWRVTSEREIRFPAAGKYPISIEFFSANSSFSVRLDLESAGYLRRKVTLADLCHD
jgi:hypothetical protein